MAEVKLDGGELVEHLTISLTMPRAFGPRLWVVGRLIWLAGLISPVKIDAKLIDNQDPNPTPQR
ncbi:hypothetical protein [Rhizobium sp. 768_B6_N1_8]|uniref:hypothetical protein n=1 Tax=unclassified Rhizobium TaxID=2613769 RepID=UPI003F260F1F